MKTMFEFPLSKTEALYRTMHNAEPKYQQNNQGIIRLRHWLKWLPKPPASIVEIGCGNGKLCNLLVDMRYDVVGFDVADGPYDRSAYKFEKLDITKMPIVCLNGEFDICLSFDVLEHIADKDIDNVLSKMKRISKEVILGIACHSPDDVLHLTVRLPQWWHGKLTTLYDEGTTSFEVIDEPKGQTLIFYGRKEE